MSEPPFKKVGGETFLKFKKKKSFDYVFWILNYMIPNTLMGILA